MPNAIPQPLSPPAEYQAGTVVRSTATFVDQNGNVIDPSVITASIQYGAVDPPGTPIAPAVIPSVTRVSTGVYYCDVPTVQWTGPGPQAVVVTWTGTGASNALLYDGFSITLTGSSAADSVGP